MRYAGIIENDCVNGEGICVSLFTQGCHRHCKGCFNQKTWDFNGGIEIKEDELINKIINLINANGIKRNLSILGGEPLCEENQAFVAVLIDAVKERYPNIKIFLWTGYRIEEVPQSIYTSIIFSKIDFIIDGEYIEEECDLSLKWRGSKNQRILTKEKIYDIIIKSKGEN